MFFNQLSLCSAMIIVFPSFFQISKISLMFSIASSSRFDVGSSNTIISGDTAETPAQAIFCFSPPDKLKMF